MIVVPINNYKSLITKNGESKTPNNAKPLVRVRRESAQKAHTGAERAGVAPRSNERGQRHLGDREREGKAKARKISPEYCEIVMKSCTILFFFDALGRFEIT